MHKSGQHTRTTYLVYSILSSAMYHRLVATAIGLKGVCAGLRLLQSPGVPGQLLWLMTTYVACHSPAIVRTYQHSSGFRTLWGSSERAEVRDVKNWRDFQRHVRHSTLGASGLATRYHFTY